MFSDDDGLEMERRMRYYVVRGMRESENKINKKKNKKKMEMENR